MAYELVAKRYLRIKISRVTPAKLLWDLWKRYYIHRCICYSLLQALKSHDEKVVGHEEVKGLSSPCLPCGLEPTEGGEELHTAVVEPLGLWAEKWGRMGREEENKKWMANDSFGIATTKCLSFPLPSLCKASVTDNQSSCCLVLHRTLVHGERKDILWWEWWRNGGGVYAEGGGFVVQEGKGVIMVERHVMMEGMGIFFGQQKQAQGTSPNLMFEKARYK